jgi:protein-L-isoaspartate(D-aspartate) O-methyltransferase
MRALADRRVMVERQLRARGIEDERVLAAMGRVPRELFVPAELRTRAYDDAALPIGEEQTISQPYMVARICAELQLRGDEKVLDVGTGSGYQAAVLAELAREVHSLERIPALAATGYADRVQVHDGDGGLGLAAEAPFGGIAVAAAARHPPAALLDQLGPRARLVIPIGPHHQQFLRVYVQTAEGATDYAAVPCRFVPLVLNG